MLRPSWLFLAAGVVLGVAAVLAHQLLFTLACTVEGESAFRRDLMERIHMLALERADRTASFHVAAGRSLVEGSSVVDVASREISAGARALARRADDLNSLLRNEGEALPNADRERIEITIKAVLASITEIEQMARDLGEDPLSVEALEATDGAARGLDKTLAAAREEAEGLALRAEARMRSSVRQGGWIGIVLGAFAGVLAGLGIVVAVRNRRAV